MLQTEVDSLPRADVDAVTATHTRTSRWDIHRITINSAAHRLKVAVACQRHSKVRAGLCHNTRTRHISQLAALRSRTQFQAPPTWARQCQCSRHSNTAAILSTTSLLHKTTVIHHSHTIVCRACPCLPRTQCILPCSSCPGCLNHNHLNPGINSPSSQANTTPCHNLRRCPEHHLRSQRGQTQAWVNHRHLRCCHPQCITLHRSRPLLRLLPSSELFARTRRS